MSRSMEILLKLATRRGAWSACSTVFLLAVAVGCQSPESSPPIAPTPPPGAAAARTWSSIRWEDQPLPQADGSLSFSGVAAGPKGVVAIGGDETGPGSNGAIWFSADGRDWVRVGEPEMLAQIQLADIAANDDGFSIIGTMGLGPTAVILQSSDGVDWQRVGDATQFANAHVGSLAGKGDEWLAVGIDGSDTDASGKAISIRYVGAAGWERLSSDDMGLSDGVVTTITPSPDGWIGTGAIGPGGRSAAVFRSADGVKWQQIILPGAAPAGEYPIATPSATVGRWATVVRGVEATNCGFLRECEYSTVTWWSADRKAWARLPASEEAPEQGSVLAAGGDVGFVAVSAGRSWVSADGLSWSAFGGVGGADRHVLDVAVIGDTVVAVGERTVGAGLYGSAGWIGIGQGRE
jgi:hypothetical protein